MLGAWSSAAPGAQPARRVLMEPLRDRLWFAGEAVHETAWGTVNGAWESGERAADAALRKIARAEGTGKAGAQNVSHSAANRNSGAALCRSGGFSCPRTRDPVLRRNRIYSPRMRE